MMTEYTFLAEPLNVVKCLRISRHCGGPGLSHCLHMDSSTGNDILGMFNIV